ncbi:thiamine phosphate synthase [Blastococcus saxobsidens]|uniref:Thiamine-phosphate synthase n=1 Tax=Blastococcus saxobsidens TaxID=138336 RepID=A0A4Q7Y9F4_9ACTN|nr:thiamine phosphate synthase [Blastococcus saxobsidens]RZU33757.1 thiamine-phosphate pyrophosphorylase [Blastococcus saxobsidens]
MRPPFDPTLYLVTDTELCRPHPVADVVRAAVAGGVTAVQVRDKHASRRELLALTRAVQAAVADRPDVPVVVNDAVDVALLAGADGVHVGQEDLPAEEVRRLLGPDRLIGLSVESADDLAVALGLPPGTVDVLGLSPVWATPTKPEAGPGLGLEAVRELARVAHAGGLLTVAIGGIDAARAADVAATGVDGICVVSAVCADPDPQEAATRLRAAMTPVGAR